MEIEGWFSQNSRNNTEGNVQNIFQNPRKTTEENTQ